MKTLSVSSSWRVFSTAFWGSKPSSSVVYRIMRPCTPPCAFTASNMSREPSPYCAVCGPSGPDSTADAPRRISSAVTPSLRAWPRPPVHKATSSTRKERNITHPPCKECADRATQAHALWLLIIIIIRSHQNRLMGVCPCLGSARNSFARSAHQAHCGRMKPSCPKPPRPGRRRWCGAQKAQRSIRA
ncbi:hypothetical protein D3C71_1288400 [compost metagenome]